MINLHNSKAKKTISTIIILVLVVAMVVPVILSAIA